MVVAGKRCPVAGRISMDLMAIDVTDLDKNAARRGHMVTLIGEGITVDELAHHFGTIGYEVLTSLGPRYARVYKGGAAATEPALDTGLISRSVFSELTPVRVRQRAKIKVEPVPIQSEWKGFDPGMKVATFNINNVNRRLPNLLRWLHQAKPDIVCLQELKATDDDFPLRAIDKAGYGAVWRGQKTWNGVAILARKAEPVLIRTELPGDRDDREARYIEAAVNGIIVTSIYLPNGNPQPGPKFDYKLEWFKRLRLHAAKFLKQDIPVVLAGDYNVAPTELDIYPTRSWDKDALIQPKSRAAFKSLVAQGWRDAIRDTASVKADVHVLGLQAQPMAARRRLAARSSAAEPGAGAAPDQGRRRPQAARRRRRQRPCAGVDRVAVRANCYASLQ